MIHIINEINFGNLSDYDIYGTPKSYEEIRESEILEKLSKNFPNDHKKQLTKLCSEFYDIFGLVSETITTSKY